jgi:ParB family chromosome partitioning protein
MTTTTATNLTGQEKEKAEKRRALGRGLESLLPGPRAVKPLAPAHSGAESPTQAAADAALKRRSSTEGAAGVVEATADTRDADSAATRASVPATHAAAATQAADTAELRSAGQPMAAVPTRAETVSAVSPAQPETPTSVATENLVVSVALTDIDRNPFQTRYVEHDDALEELADSIRANGVVQPIVVRPAEEGGRFVLILGERRLHASKRAGKTHIPAMVRRVSEQHAAEMTIVENLQREDLSPLEQAEAFRVLSSQFQLTQQQIAERVGLSRESVANYMRLLKLPREVMQMLAEKRINFAQAKELLRLGDNDRIAEAALYAVKKGMNVEQVEMLVLRMDGLLDPLPGMPGVQKKEKTGAARWVDPNVRAAQMDLERTLGLRVRIRDRKGKGKIVIEYSTVDDYERVVEIIRGQGSGVRG